MKKKKNCSGTAYLYCKQYFRVSQMYKSYGVPDISILAGSTSDLLTYLQYKTKTDTNLKQKIKMF